ncbi:MAG: hypothetical protein AB1595_00675 [bacterium]
MDEDEIINAIREGGIVSVASITGLALTKVLLLDRNLYRGRIKNDKR